MMVLPDVKLQNQGVYTCSSLDFESGEEVRGNTTLEIHCALRFAETSFVKAAGSSRLTSVLVSLPSCVRSARRCGDP